MKVIADLCVVPIGAGTSVSKEIAACERVLAEAGLKTKLHAYGTNIEGEWDNVFAATLRFGTRIDREPARQFHCPARGQAAARTVST